MDLPKYHGKGLSGLANLGNTCFLNSCIQVLNHTYELHAIVDSPRCGKYMKTDLVDSTILSEWNSLRHMMWDKNVIISPNKFVANVQKVALEKQRELFTGWAQNDMPEFLLFLVECMHNSIARPMVMNISGTMQNSTDELAIKCFQMLKTIYQKEYSEVMDLFYGIYVSQITSINGKHIHGLKPESYFILDLPIPEKPGDVNIYDCLDYFTMNEVMQGDNAWFNEKTNMKEDVQKKITFWNFPKVLVITLKRFSPDGLEKINHLVDFPLDNLDLSTYVSGYNPHQYVYELYGVCNHIGNVMGGHYTAFVKNSTQQWHHYNDTNVTPNTTIVTPMAYCLFYRKKNNLV